MICYEEAAYESDASDLVAMRSIAISLKRIADALWYDDRGVTAVLDDIDTRLFRLSGDFKDQGDVALIAEQLKRLSMVLEGGR